MLILGTRSADQFILSPQGISETVFGFRGDDIIAEQMSFQSISDDFLFGGAGNDTITSWSGHDVIKGGKGDDVVFLHGNEAATASGGAGYDILYIGGVTNVPNVLQKWGVDFPVDLPDKDDGSSEPPVVPHHFKGFEEIIYL